MPSSIRTVSAEEPARRAKDGLLDGLVKDFEEDHQASIGSFIKSRRADAYILMPELAMAPAKDLVGRLRELAHIIRPLVYVYGVSMANCRHGGSGGKAKWAVWGLALGLELFSLYPDLVSLASSGKHALLPETERGASPIEKGEGQHRLAQLFMFLLREPFYDAQAKGHLDKLKGILGEWRVLRPLVETATTYQALWERVYFYTSSS
jgi:hypothetical protein